MGKTRSAQKGGSFLDQRFVRQNIAKGKGRRKINNKTQKGGGLSDLIPKDPAKRAAIKETAKFVGSKLKKVNWGKILFGF